MRIKVSYIREYLLKTTLHQFFRREIYGIMFVKAYQLWYTPSSLMWHIWLCFTIFVVMPIFPNFTNGNIRCCFKGLL